MNTSPRRSTTTCLCGPVAAPWRAAWNWSATVGSASPANTTVTWSGAACTVYANATAGRHPPDRATRSPQKQPNRNDARRLLFGCIAARSVRHRIDAGHLDGRRTAVTLGAARPPMTYNSPAGGHSRQFRPVHACAPGRGLRASNAGDTGGDSPGGRVRDGWWGLRRVAVQVGEPVAS